MLGPKKGFSSMRLRSICASIFAVALVSACASDRGGAKTDAPAEGAAAEPAATGAGKAFDRTAAMAALSAAADAARACKADEGPTGRGKIQVTFAPSGSVTSAIVEGPPFAGTPVGGCVASAFTGARVPPFDGAPVDITKSFDIE